MLGTDILPPRGGRLGRSCSTTAETRSEENKNNAGLYVQEVWGGTARAITRKGKTLPTRIARLDSHGVAFPPRVDIEVKLDMLEEEREYLLEM